MRKRRLWIGGLAAALALTQPGFSYLPGVMGGFAAEAQAAVTYSQYWFQDEAGNWRLRDASGKAVANAWVCDDAVAANRKNVWYLLDADGLMVSAGLVQDGTGNYYSLEMNHDGYFGMLR